MITAQAHDGMVAAFGLCHPMNPEGMWRRALPSGRENVFF
jgi:hypothetical protein